MDQASRERVFAQASAILRDLVSAIVASRCVDPLAVVLTLVHETAGVAMSAAVRAQARSVGHGFSLLVGERASCPASFEGAFGPNDIATLVALGGEYIAVPVPLARGHDDPAPDAWILRIEAFGRRRCALEDKLASLGWSRGRIRHALRDVGEAQRGLVDQYCSGSLDVVARRLARGEAALSVIERELAGGPVDDHATPPELH